MYLVPNDTLSTIGMHLKDQIPRVHLTTISARRDPQPAVHTAHYAVPGRLSEGATGETGVEGSVDAALCVVSTALCVIC